MDTVFKPNLFYLSNWSFVASYEVLLSRADLRNYHVLKEYDCKKSLKILGRDAESINDEYH